MKSNHPEIRAIVFDLGRVLLDFDWSVALDRLAERSAPDREQIFERISGHSSHRAFEMGQISSVDFFSSWKQALKFEGSLQELEAIWNDIFEPIPENIKILQVLSSRYKTAILSNTNPAHLESLRKSYDFFNRLDYGCYSHEVSLRKPDAAIYELVGKQLQEDPERMIFIDDLAENVAGARAIGMQAIHFQGQNLQQELQSLGVDL